MPASAVALAVLDAATGQPLEGHSLDECSTIEMDGVSQVIRWSDASRVKLERDRPVLLQFELRGRQSRLYGFAWQRDNEL